VLKETVFLLIFFTLTITPSLADTIHAVIVADTGTWDGGASFNTDLNRMSKLVRKISQHTTLTLNLKEISGNRLTVNNLMSTVEKLPIQQNRDVVIFYYSGHGGRNRGKWSLWPLMDIEGGALAIDWVKSTLKQKEPRFFIILADTCNNFDDSLNPVWGRNPNSARGKPQSQNYRQLFLNYRGYIFASAVEPGHYAWGNAQYGGFFTDAFLNSLNKELASSSDPNWYTIMKRAEAPIEVEGRVQNPQTLVKIQPAKSWVAPPQPDSCYYFYKPGGVLCCRTPSGTTCGNRTGNLREGSSGNTDGECPHYFMKPGGVLCCKRPTGVTCE